MAQTGDLRVRISAQDQASSVIGTVKKSIIGLGAAWVSVAGARMLVDTMKDTINTFTQYTSEIDKANKITGIATDKLQELGYAAKQEHGSFESLQKGLMNLTVRLGYAGDGLETYTRYFRALGIEYKKADGTLRDAYDVFLNIADVVKKGNLSTEELAATMQLFGARSAKELIPLLKKGSEWFKEMGKEARELNIVLKDGTIVQGKELADVFTRIAERGEGVKLMVAEKMLPAFETLLPIFEDYVKWATKLIDVYDPLFKAVEKLYNMSLSEEQQKLRLLELWKKDTKEKRENKAALETQAEAELEAAAARATAHKEWLAEVKPLSAWIEELVDGTEISRVAFMNLQGQLDQLTPVLARVREETDKFKDPFVGTDFVDGIKDVSGEMINNFGAGTLQMFEELRHSAAMFTNQWASGVIDSIFEANLAFGQFVKDFIVGMTKMILKMLAFKAIKSIFGLGMFGGGGLVPAFQAGGYVMGPGGYDKVMARLTAGEFVMNRNATQRIGVDNLERMNRGDTFNSPITVNVNVSGAGGGSQGGYAIARVLEHELPRIMKNLERRRKV